MSRPTLEVADIVRRTNSFWERQQSHHPSLTPAQSQGGAVLTAHERLTARKVVICPPH
jgi:hypothetical protein